MITRNEEGAIAKVVDDAFAALPGCEVIVVDLPSGDLGIGPDLSNGIPSQLVFGGTPGETATGSSGVAFSPQPVVSVLDSNNEVVESDLSPIVLSIEGNPVGVSISGCSANDPRCV